MAALAKIIAAAWLATAGPASVDDDAAAIQFRRGAAAFDEGEYELALRLFSAAQDLAPHASTAYRVGLCLEELGRFTEAVERYKEVENAESANQEQVLIARGRRQVAESKQVKLTVEGPEGAEVQLDGEPLCNLPCARAIDPGGHDLVVAFDGADFRRSLELQPGQRKHVTVVQPGGPPSTSIPPDTSAGVRARWPGALTWVGGSVALLGGAGTLGFGLTAQRVQDEHQMNATGDTQSRGRRFQALTNVSIGVLAVGGVMIVADAIRVAVQRKRSRGQQGTR